MYVLDVATLQFFMWRPPHRKAVPNTHTRVVAAPKWPPCERHSVRTLSVPWPREFPVSPSHPQVWPYPCFLHRFIWKVSSILPDFELQKSEITLWRPSLVWLLLLHTVCMKFVLITAHSSGFMAAQYSIT